MNANAQQAFHEAIQNDDIETARRMIAAGADVNIPYAGQHYSLHTACCNGHYELVRLLIESGADVNVRDNNESTPLLECDSYYPEIIKLLLDAGAQVNVRDGENNTPLLFAAMTGKPESVKLLLDAGAHVNVHGDDSHETPYDLARFEANHMGNEYAQEIMELLKAAGALECVTLDIEDFPEISPINYEYLQAVQMQDTKRIIAALNMGANVNATDRFGTSAIEQAIMYNNGDLCRLLVNSGISKDHIFEAFWSLYRPLTYDNIDLIWYLFSQLEGEMLVKAKEIALSYAASGGCLEATKLLLEEKVNPNCINTRDETPLECAIHAWRNAEETINLLLDNGADINRVSNNGWSVLMQSLSNGLTTNLSICRLLLERGADYTYVNKEGRSAYTVSRMWKFIADFYDNTIKELTNKNNSQLSL